MAPRAAQPQRPNNSQGSEKSTRALTETGCPNCSKMLKNVKPGQVCYCSCVWI